MRRIAATLAIAVTLVGCEKVDPRSGWELRAMAPQERAAVLRQQERERADHAAWLRQLEFADAQAPRVLYYGRPPW